MLFAMLFLSLSLQSQQCEIPRWIYIQDAQDPCWTIERLRSQYSEAEGNVFFYRWLMDKPFSRTDFLEEESFSLRLIVIEHPDVFMVGDSQAIGVFRAGAFSSIDTIEYSLKHEKEGPIQVLRHELGHLRELKEEIKLDALNAFTKFGWWHFGHGDFLDPLVQATNWVKNWFYRGLPERHSYYPGQVGREPQKGTPGSLPPVLPPVSMTEQLKLFSDFKYHVEHHPEHRIAACILRPL